MNITVIIGLFIYFLLWFLIATAIKNAGIVDIAWGLGFVFLAVMQQLLFGLTESWILVFIVALWGLRLTYHIGLRNIGKPEDFRYANWRKEWGSNFVLRSFFQVFMLQGAIMLVVAWPFLDAIQKSLTSPLLVGVGLAIFLIGYAFEAIGDAQLKRHVTNPKTKGTLITTGLWSITRHPNYFGDATLWWGIFMVALGFNASFITIIGPVIMSYLLRYVSGVPLLEKRMEKYENFQEYKNRVSIFVPFISKKG